MIRWVVEKLAKRYGLTDDPNGFNSRRAERRPINDQVTATLENTLYRTRFEMLHNPLACGIGDTLATDITGNGPMLQMPGNAQAEKLWREWSNDPFKCDVTCTSSLADIVDLISLQKWECGEAFVYLYDEKDNVKLLAIDPARISSPATKPDGDMMYRGIEYDTFGKPVAYWVAPSDDSLSTEYLQIPAANMAHLFTVKYPGQKRGLPEMEPSLDTFSNIQEYTDSVLEAAETAAKLTLIEQTAMGHNPAAKARAYGQEVTDDSEITIRRGTKMKTAPGSTIAQLRAEQPTNTYDAFVKRLTAFAGRPVSMPRNIAGCDSSDYNYASGQLDHLTYFGRIRKCRRQIETQLLNRLVYRLFRLKRLAGAFAGNVDEFSFYWRDRGHADPVKVAKANEIKLESRQTTHSDVHAAEGKDWEKQFEQMAAEKETLKAMGLIEDKTDPDKRMESLSRAVRNGITVTIDEARAAVGLKSLGGEEGKRKLRFNNDDILQYHIENDILLVNEIRAALNYKDLPDGDVTVSEWKSKQAPQTPGGKGSEVDTVETDTDKKEEQTGTD